MSVADKQPTKQKRVKKPVAAVVRAMSGAPEPKTVIGPQTKFTKQRFDEICAGIARGKTLAELLEIPGMPSRRGFLDWCDSDELLASQYARARQLGFDAIAEDLVRISDIERLGKTVTTDETGRESITTKDMVEARRLQIDARKWLLARWDSKRYGDKLLHTGADGESPLSIEFYMPNNGRDSSK